MNTTATPRIERGATYLVVSIREEKAKFVFPPIGPGSYDIAVKEVLARGLKLPTGEQTAFLLNEVYNSNAPQFKDSSEAEFVRKNIIKDGCLRVPNINIWTPKRVENPGLYVVHDENGKGLSEKIDTNVLEDRLSGGSTERQGVRFSRDRKVAFAPLNTITAGSHIKGALAQDGAYIANYGVEGAVRLDKVDARFALNPYSFVVDHTENDQIQSLSALDRYWLHSVGLGADFISNGADGYGFVFGLAGSDLSAEGTAPKK